MTLETAVQNIHWLGHDSIRIEGEKRIYIDPFKIGAEPEADIILVTHEHFDHCSVEDIEKIKKKDTTIITEPVSAKKLKGDVKIVSPNDRIDVKGIEIEAVPSYNTNKKFHPKENNWLGFIVNIDGVTIYHAGDTDFIPEMQDIKADIALLPVSGTYVMTAEEAADAALAVNPSVAIPIHYGAIVGSDKDALKFKELLQGKIEVKILSRE